MSAAGSRSWALALVARPFGAAGSNVGEVDPLRVDVQLHRLYRARPHKEVGEVYSVKAGSTHVDESAVFGHPDA